MAPSMYKRALEPLAYLATTCGCRPDALPTRQRLPHEPGRLPWPPMSRASGGHMHMACGSGGASCLCRDKAVQEAEGITAKPVVVCIMHEGHQPSDHGRMPRQCWIASNALSLGGRVPKSALFLSLPRCGRAVPDLCASLPIGRVVPSVSDASHLS